MAAPSELRGSVQKSHRRRRPRQSPQQQLPGLAAVKEVARLRRGGRMFVSRLPYQHLIKEVARPLQNKVNIFYTASNIFCKLLNILPQVCHGDHDMVQAATDAYLAGIYEGFINVCPQVSNFTLTALILTQNPIPSP